MIPWDAFFGWFEAHETLMGWLGLFSIVMFIGTLVVIPLIIVVLPRDFLTRKDEKIGRQVLNIWYVPYWMAKNVLGATFVLAGVAMLVLPGQGLLSILIGLGLLTFPGKRRLIRRILGFRKVVRIINSLRARFGKEPIRVPKSKPQKSMMVGPK
jgi:hypothetical protein